MVILLESHKKKVKNMQRHLIIAIGVCLLVLITLPVLFFKSKAEWDYLIMKLEEEKNGLKGEIRVLEIKQEILKILKSKPITIGQAIEIVDAIANYQDIPISIILAIFEQESDFRPIATSYKGARGLTQVMPSTVKSYIKDPILQKQIDRPSVNVTAGLMHLTYLYKKYGKWDRTLRAYFAGDENADNKIYDWYYKAVLRKADKYKYLD